MKLDQLTMKQVNTIILLAALSLVLGCNDSNSEDRDKNLTEPAAPLITWTVVNKFPHDTGSFTQGLVIYNGQLYESTGSPDGSPSNNGSWIGPVDLATGKKTVKDSLDKKYFGEGMTILHDKAYYITWQSKKGFVYQLPAWKKIKEFSYTTEGWGLTNDGANLIMSDGSNKLYYFSPDSLRLLSITSVFDHNGPVPNINELEFIHGAIYANIWGMNHILRIDPESGKVTGRMDLGDLAREAQNAGVGADVLNGIAFDSSANKLYVTGKKWPILYEIKMQ
ncbi:MAG: glutaminyl-peptide cyclotransferase [Candidatus Pseudobacter hemicellulosilyticus]|uniref:Glutaminyl-peptide cyclotransferase n=1 Tax=Candidatus Pseudobacter hemicellulosilyticus TaxID=3121375 RepID=A0AAJ5WSA3_9BACT|nr:MAG: glutaminyl-peptide cyclotransferase [Pseudobacter sp.]